MDILTLVATVAGILGFLYILIIGQKSIPEWLREKRASKQNSSGADQTNLSISIPPRPVQHNGCIT